MEGAATTYSYGLVSRFERGKQYWSPLANGVVPLVLHWEGTISVKSIIY